jgi:hypothetical protein
MFQRLWKGTLAPSCRARLSEWEIRFAFIYVEEKFQPAVDFVLRHTEDGHQFAHRSD